MSDLIALRRATAAQWAAANPTLFAGEMGLETDTGLFKVGDGVTAWAGRPYGGVQGPAGADGAAGAQGPAGPDGPQGPPGTTDYNALTNLPTLGNAAAKNTGTGAGDVAVGNHNHDAAYSAIGHAHAGVYEPANANLQAHVASAHAPSDAQKNSDITKAEIEAKLTGEIASHTHAGGAGGAGMLCLPFVADGANLALTNMALALQFLGNSHRFATRADLTSFTQCRLVVNKQATAGAAASKIILRYITAFNVTAANWSDIGASEVSVAINVQNTVLATAWINITALAKADVFICPLMSGGDGALDPVVGNITAQFK